MTEKESTEIANREAQDRAVKELSMAKAYSADNYNGASTAQDPDYVSGQSATTTDNRAPWANPAPCGCDIASWG